jgi:hypothetical protein
MYLYSFLWFNLFDVYHFCLLVIQFVKIVPEPFVL